MKIIHVSQLIPTFSGYPDTVDFCLLQKKKRIRVRICQIMTMNTKAHNTYPGNCTTLSPIICWAQWLKHETQLGEGGPRHRLAVWCPWFVSHQRSVSGPRLKVADRCGESRGTTAAAHGSKKTLREPFWICDGVLALTTAFNNTGQKNKK